MVTITAPTYVPFEPRTDEQRATRERLRTALRGIAPVPGHVLYGALSGRVPPGADVENALFYNLDAAGVFPAMRDGVIFEADPAPDDDGVRFEYDMVSTAEAHRLWRPERELALLDATLESSPSVAGLWWAVRQQPGVVHTIDGVRPDGAPFMLDLALTGPAAGLTPGLLKTVLDGVICGLQSETAIEVAVGAAPPLAAAVGTASDRVVEALTGGPVGVLGAKRGLVHSWGRSIKWEPDDHCCVAARLRFETASTWTITGKTSIATATSRDR